MKGVIQPDHMPVNNYELLLVGMVPLTAIEISGLEDELEVVDLPDRTKASGGNRKSTEFTMKIPMHHTLEMAACEIWFQEGQDPVLPTYKKGGSLIHKSLSGNIVRTYTLIGVFLSKRVLPDLEMANEGEMAAVEYTVSVDDILPI